MRNVDFKQIASRYEKELRENCLPFWLEHSQDNVFGGYFSCLDRDGSVYDRIPSGSHAPFKGQNSSRSTVMTTIGTFTFRSIARAGL